MREGPGGAATLAPPSLPVPPPCIMPVNPRTIRASAIPWGAFTVIIPADFAQVTLIFTGAALPTGAASTFGIDVGSTAGTPADVAQAVGSAWTTAQCESIMVLEVTLSEILVKFGPNATGPSDSSVPSVAGTDSRVGVPPNTSYLIQKRTALGGRQGRGRMYWPGIPEAEVNEAGTLNSAWVLAAQAVITDFYDQLTLSTLVPVLLHSEDSPPFVPLTIQSFDLSSVVATQRQRLRR